MTLRTLHLRNLILVEKATITFDSGLTVISGETGSGKSAILEAIQLLLGGRSDPQLIRQGAESASVEAEIELPANHPVLATLAERGFQIDDEPYLILKRELSTNGKSRAFINHRPAQVSLLKELGSGLIEIVAQHASQELYAAENHLLLLDLYGDITSQADAFTDAYETYKGRLQELETLKSRLPQKERECSICVHEIEEIESAKLKEGEEESLYDEVQHLASADDRMQLSSKLDQALGGERGVLALLKSLKSPFAELAHIAPELAPEKELYETVCVETEELVHTLRSYQNKIDADPNRLNFLNERIALITKLQRKYGKSYAEIQTYLKTRQEALKAWELLEDAISALENDLQIELKHLEVQAEKLQQKRAKSAEKLEKAIVKEFKELNMPQAKLNVLFTPQTMTRNGSHRIEFLLSANMGEPFLCLKESASGGELSRVLLAIKLLLADKEKLSTLIFDEIDANIGGTTAALIGEKLHTLGKSLQVLCITHFPQVAKCADHHLFIAKEQQKGRTFTTIATLSIDERSHELKRMSGDLTNMALSR
jgi:DNA repair protein RecN (Recombination protein N)